MIFHNAFIDLQLTMRNSSTDSGNTKAIYGALGFRMNMGERRFEF
jgi:hypothetical protein